MLTVFSLNDSNLQNKHSSYTCCDKLYSMSFMYVEYTKLNLNQYKKWHKAKY